MKDGEIKRDWVNRENRKMLPVDSDEWTSSRSGSKDLDFGIEEEKYLDKVRFALRVVFSELTFVS